MTKMFKNLRSHDDSSLTGGRGRCAKCKHKQKTTEV